MRMLSIPLCMAACAAALSAFADNLESVTSWADDAIAVDASVDGFRIATGAVSLRCSPDWCTGGTNVTGSLYSLRAVTDPDTANAVTSAVPALVYSGECNVPYSGSGYVRFLLSAEIGGEPVGETLTSDVSFGVMSALSSAVAYDNRGSSLQEAVVSGGAVNLDYDTFWTEGAASVEIGAVHLSGEGGDATATNALFAAAAEADGAFAMRSLGRGWWRLLCQLKGESGETLLEYLTDEFKMPGGLLMSIR